ncbi:MAG TPA: undecaprenyl diphosphate synthase family protein, partial [Mobilitalea sp.]|nr:undecaprenyl diphosphate synthase family protein [Mobilitalea sp.]
MKIPKHIGIIPDGNRRWAKSRGLGAQEGYEYGLQPGLTLLRQAKAYGI